MLYAVKDSLEEENGADEGLLHVLNVVASVSDDVERISSRWTLIELGVECVNNCFGEIP